VISVVDVSKRKRRQTVTKCRSSHYIGYTILNLISTWDDFLLLLTDRQTQIDRQTDVARTDRKMLQRVKDLVVARDDSDDDDDDDEVLVDLCRLLAESEGLTKHMCSVMMSAVVAGPSCTDDGRTANL